MDNNEEQMTPEILKGMDEMTNIQNVVKTINCDMINATKVCLDVSKQLVGRMCHPVPMGKIEPHLGDQVMGELGGEKLVLKEDGSLTTVPNFDHTGFIQEMKPVLEDDGTVSIVPKNEDCAVKTDMRIHQKNTIIVNLYGSPGTGKCFGAGTKVLMYDGSVKNVEDIMVGDVVMGDDSTPRNVIELHRGRSPMYKLHRSHSKDIIISDSHVLSLMRYHVNKDWTYNDITVDDYLRTTRKNKHYSRLYKRGVTFTNKVSLKIDPYYLGYWLGDGFSEGLGRFCTADKEIVDFCELYAKQLHLVLKQYSNTDGPCQSYCLSAGNIGNHARHPLGGNPYGLIKNKHIPIEYMTAPLSDRLSLIAGLIDSDGCLSRTGYDWINKNQQLAYDFYRLVNSCGLRAVIHKCTKRCNSYKCNPYKGTYYRVSITGDISKIPVKITRKKTNNMVKDPDRVLRECFKVESLPENDYYGFTTDGNQRFLLDDCTVVHNSTGAAYIFSKLKMAGVDAEYVTEFAKDKVWEGSQEAFKCQFYITGKQAFRVSRCFGKVDVIVTDSPILLGKIYADKIGRPSLGMACVEEAKQYWDNSIEIFLNRIKPYNPNGRNQTELESDRIAEDIRRMLDEQQVSYEVETGDQSGYDRVVDRVKHILERHKSEPFFINLDKQKE